MTSTHPSLRVLIHSPGTGPWNMAVDEVLLEGGPGLPAYTLRFYRWLRPTVSLGHGQPWREAYDGELGRRLGVDLVRRPTGGRAVLHADELTYSLAAPADRGPLSGGVLSTYRRIARCFERGFRSLGLTVELVRGAGAVEPGRGACFASRSRYELLAGGRKLLGSAQRRQRGRLLQHGSLPLGRPDLRLWRVLGEGGAGAARQTAGLAEELGHRPPWRRLGWGLARAVADGLQLELRAGTLSRQEARRARRRALLLGDAAWVRRR